MDDRENFTYYTRMIGFLIKKTFFDVWGPIMRPHQINAPEPVRAFLEQILNGVGPINLHLEKRL